MGNQSAKVKATMLVSMSDFMMISFQKKILILREQDNCFNANRRTLNYQRVSRCRCTFPFVLLKQIANLVTLFRQRTFHYVSCRAFLEGSKEEKYFFYLVSLLPVLIPTYMRNLKIICQGKCVKLTNRQVCLSKPLKI